MGRRRVPGTVGRRWRHITPDRLETAQREAFALLDQVREPDGSNPRTMLFACTTGRKEAR